MRKYISIALVAILSFTTSYGAGPVKKVPKGEMKNQNFIELKEWKYAKILSVIIASFTIMIYILLS